MWPGERAAARWSPLSSAAAASTTPRRRVIITIIVCCARGQQLRDAVPDHDVWRVARPGARRRRRWLSGAVAARSGGDPARARSASPGTVAPGDPAQGDGPDRDPVRRARRAHARDADRDGHPQRGRARQGLRRDGRSVPAEPRRLHVRREVRDPRESPAARSRSNFWRMPASRSSLGSTRWLASRRPSTTRR